MQLNSSLDRVLFGDNQFFGVNHASDEKSRAQAMRFKDDQSIIRVLDQAIDLGVRTFMCTTHDRIANICDHIRTHPDRYRYFKVLPCMPYAHKYANAVTELGIMGTINQYVPGSIFGTFAKGGMAMVQGNYSKLMQILIDAEMKMFAGIDTPVIFIQNVLVDMILGLGMYDVFRDYDDYIRKRYGAEPGYITMNMPDLVDALESVGIYNPIICSSINKAGFRMSGGIERNERYLREKTFRPIAMQVLAAGTLRPKEAFAYLAQFPRIESVLFGSSSKQHIAENIELIESTSMVAQEV
ncbi:hypothetical protein GGR28_003136 [Lewinella aquimaris]|uniref:Uncharacterized protein n=1 Tax=Neolewinella aquimaris TaxID=1835722 RepID=A0A840E9V1_9BACT|nr:hypothetical protein [Neolewinella aquimaris]MBB4080502.1 hypothetical protein [Neolewinella aquimaris]